MPDIIEIGKAIAQSFVELMVFFKLKKRKAKIDAFDDSLHITEIAHKVITNGHSIDFLFVVMIHNGGKKIRPHDFKYRSIVGGDYNDFTLKNFEWRNHRRVEIDFEYEMLMRKVRKLEVVDVRNNEFMQGGRIKNANDFEGIKFKRYFYLHSDESAMWIAVAGTTAANETLTSVSQRHCLIVAVNDIKNIILKY